MLSGAWHLSWDSRRHWGLKDLCKSGTILKISPTFLQDGSGFPSHQLLPGDMSSVQPNKCRPRIWTCFCLGEMRPVWIPSQTACLVKIEWGGGNYLSICTSAWDDWKGTFKQKVVSALIRAGRLCLLFGEWHLCWCFPASSSCVCLFWLLDACGRQDHRGSLSRLSLRGNKPSLAKSQGCSWAPEQWEGWTWWRSSVREMLLLEIINSLERTHTSVRAQTTVRYFYDKKKRKHFI